MRSRYTYVLGFFLGPGLPRARPAASVCPFVRLLPGLGPGTPFRRGVSPGVAPLAGVEVASASEALSAEDGRTTGTSVDEAGEERSAPLSATASLGVLCSGVSEAISRRTLGDIFSLMMSD